MGCLTEEDVLALSQGAVPVDARERLDEHLDGCADCRAMVGEVAKLAVEQKSVQSAIDRSPEPVTVNMGQRPNDPTLAQGTTVSRYVVQRLIGAGSWGEVYEAFDPQLMRRTALKLLRPVRMAGQSTGQVRGRLLREAQAMAQLSHPNVVGVHDTGTFEDRVFIVMEHVEGESLAAWLGRAPRSWRDILDVFIAAGRGLSAAHPANLVHRDFKPDNVLVAADGQVRVTDFGLARFLAPAPGSGDEPFVSAARGRDSALAGTPAFMAPEQFQGSPVSASSDQFSFCVALYWAFYGRHPLRPEPESPPCRAGSPGLRSIAGKRSPSFASGTPGPITPTPGTPTRCCAMA